MTGRLPLVSVVIPVRDDPDGLRRCLRALAAQDYPPDRLEVLVVDNGSVASLEGVVHQQPHVRLLAEPAGGSYAARNHGVAEAHGEVIAFTDADCRPDPGWLRAGVDAITDRRDVGLVAGRIEVVVADRARPTPVEAYELLHAFPQERYARLHHFAATANAFTRRDVLREVGWFDPSLRSGGDKEWGARLRSVGYGIRYCPDALVRHPARATLAQLHAKFVRVFDGERVLRARVGSTLEGPADLRWWRRLVPPLRAIARAWRGRELPGPRAKLAYTVGVVLARYVGLWVGLRARYGASPVGASDEAAAHA
ncbi:MAG TPA: glycosyltransferase [Nitriliruptorales bacterium]|nr:glycosyltransferase [Nitriliruptorales bacterium]